MCRVLNKRSTGVPAGTIYIGRGSNWGNPFRIGPDGNRAAVIAKYEGSLRDQHHLLRALDELRGHNLVCFCAPLACHSDLLLWLANASRKTIRVGGHADRADVVRVASALGRVGPSTVTPRFERKRLAGKGLSRRGRERAPRGSILPQLFRGSLP